MRRDERAGLLAYRFDSLPRDRVDALVSTRLGGVSQGGYASLNLGLGVGDDPERVIANRERLFAAYELPLDRSIWCRQVHGNDVAVVTADHLRDADRGVFTEDAAIPGVDALVTDLVDVPLCVLSADCVPVVLYDPEHPAVGLVHAGWQGTVARIASRTVDVMRERYGSDPASLLAAVGPSIGPSHYEVGEDVSFRVRDAYGDAPILRDLGGGGKALLDLWEANTLDLERAGVERDRIEVAGSSTLAALDELYSFRAETRGGATRRTGRFATVVMLRA